MTESNSHISLGFLISAGLFSLITILRIISIKKHLKC